jgi:cytochrome c biogenesis protein CcmG, thiol:disulfide interchange protein DsbE
VKRRWLVWLPLAIVLILLSLLFYGLRKPVDNAIVSKMVGKPLPEFTAVAVLPGQPGMVTVDYQQGKPRLLNVFASWCLPCVAEIPVLLRLKAMGVQIDGLAVHDTPEALQKFLVRNGNPYGRIGRDDVSRLQMALGSSGVPETFVVDGKGIIRYQHIGVVSERDIPVLMEKMGSAQ